MKLDAAIQLEAGQKEAETVVRREENTEILNYRIVCSCMAVFWLNVKTSNK